MPPDIQNNKMTQKDGTHTDDHTIETFLQSAPEEGSLALLAFGSAGVMAWRKKREAIRQERERGDMKEKGVTNG